MSDHRIRRAFDHLRADVERTVRPHAGLERIKARRLRWQTVLVPAVGIVALVAAVAGAVLLLRDDETPDETTLPPATTVTTVPATATTVPPETVATTTTLAPVAALAPGEVVYAAADGIYADDGSGPRQLTTAVARVAVSDLQGGLVFEDSAGLWHLPTGVDAPTQLTPGGALHDLVVVDGRRAVVYAAATGGGEEVRLRYLDDGVETGVYTFAGTEGGVTRVSYGGGLFAITVRAEGFSWFALVTPDGLEAPLVNPRPVARAEIDGLWADQAILAPGGTTLIYLEGALFGADQSLSLVVWDVLAGDELRRFGLPATVNRTERADFDGQRLAVTRLDGQRTPEVPLLISGIESGAVVSDGALTGRVSLAKEPGAWPTGSIVPDPGDAVIPPEGLGRGALLATHEQVVWYPDAYTVAEPLPLWVFAEDETFLGDSKRAFGDGAGGVVFGGGASPLRWLRPGVARPTVVQPEPSGFIQLMGVAEVDGVPTAFFVASATDDELWLADLETGRQRRLDTFRGVGVTNVSFGGGRFVVATIDFDGACTAVLSVTPAGVRGEVPGAPRPACDGFPEQWLGGARISPDGRLLAYLESEAVGRDAELGDLLTEAPPELVVRDLTGGRELLRTRAGSAYQGFVRLYDFDGARIALSREGFEPALAPQVLQVVDLACEDCLQRLDGVAAGLGLVGSSGALDTVLFDGGLFACSADGFTSLPSPQPELPAVVADLRDRIRSAAIACDFDALDTLALEGEFGFHFDLGTPGMFRQADANRPELDLIANILDQPFGTIPDGVGGVIYVWPRVFAYENWDAVPPEDRNQLLRIYSAEDQAQFAEFGGYFGYRIGITEAGDWLFVALGD